MHEGHPRAGSDLWPLLVMGTILGLQVTLLQVAVNRLAWGMYDEVLAPAAATLGLALIAWLLWRQLNRETVD